MASGTMKGSSRVQSITLARHVLDDSWQDSGKVGLAQHRHAAQQLTVEHGEAIDAGDDDVLDRVGSAPTASPFNTAAISSRRKSGFPRTDRRGAPCRGAGKSDSRVAAKASSAASTSSQRVELQPGDRSCPRVREAGRDVAAGAGTTATTYRVRWTTRATCPKRSADASSMKWTSSMVISPDCGKSTASKAMTDSASFVRLNSSSSAAVSCVSGTGTRWPCR